MSYEKQNFVDGQTLTAAHLNHMEAGIAAAATGVKGDKGEDRKSTRLNSSHP